MNHLSQRIGLSAILIILNVVLTAQETETLQLKHQASGLPVEGVSYLYGNQSGTSGSDGTIKLTFIKDAALKLSHISYGTIVFQPEDLSEIRQAGVIELNQKPRLIQSLNILGVRPKQESKEHTTLKTIEALSHDAGVILTRLPSISSIRKGGGYGFDPVLRGFKYDQVKILIDGIQTTTVACPNRMDPPTSQVSVNTLSAVEIHKGPYSLRYGNNIGGAINFQSADRYPNSGNGPFGRISGGFEANGSVMRTEALAGIRTKNGMFRFSGSLGNGNDYTDGNGNPVPASFTRANAGVAGAVGLGDHQEIGVTLTRNFARDADYPALPMDLRSDDTWLVHLSHQLAIGGNRSGSLNTSAYASIVDHLMDNLGKTMDPRMVNAETAVKTRNIGAKTEYSLKQGLFSLVSGVDFNLENADGYRTREFLMGPNTGNILTDNVWQNGLILRTGLFSEYSRVKQQWRATVSGRLNVNRSDAGQPDPSFESLYETLATTQVNPGISGGIEHLGRIFSWAIWAGRVQRSGNLSERFMNSFPVGLDPYELIGNPALKPEINNQADLVIEFGQLENARLELDLFYSFLQDFISSTIREDLNPKMPSAPGVRQYDNIDRAQMTGAELSYIQELPLNLQSRIDLAATYGANLVSREPLPEIPPLDIRWTLSGKYFSNSLQPALYVRHVRQQDRISTVFGETATPAFWLIDMDISYRFRNLLEFSAGIRNLLDTAYYEHLNRSVRGTNTPIYNTGRNIFLALTLQFD